MFPDNRVLHRNKRIPIFLKKLLDKKEKNGSHDDIMNMHHITKSLFVGAAIAGIGMSSGKAELQLGERSKAWAQRIIRDLVDERYNKLRECLPSDLNFYIQGLDSRWPDYQKEATYDTWKEEDVKTISDSLFGEGGYLSYFEDAEDYLKGPNGDPSETLKKFFEAKFSFNFVAPDFLGKAIEGEKLNLMLFLKKVASRCGGATYGYGCYYYSSFEDEYCKALRDKGMIKEGKWLQVGHYLPEWSFIFDNYFIDSITLPITRDAEQQIHNEDAKQQINKK